MVEFIIQATRGVLHDERFRRKAMAILLVLALAMVAAGMTVLRPSLEPREHVGRFVLFWFACAWVTLTALLLALLDLLSVRARTRRARKVLREDLKPPEPGLPEQESVAAGAKGPPLEERAQQE